MYRVAADAFVAIWPALLTAAVCLAGLKTILDEGTSTLGGALVVYAMIALYAHRAILLGETMRWRDSFKRAKSDATPAKFGPFLWRMFGWWLFAGTIWLCSFLILRWLFLPSFKGLTSDEFAGAVIISLIPTVIVTLPVLAALGTVLPAAAVGGDDRLAAAWRRGRQTFWRTLGRIWGGNILFFVIANGVLLWLIPTTGVIVIDGAFQILFELVGFFAILLTASALSLAYQRADAALDVPD